jgi:hypothetical protein
MLEKIGGLAAEPVLHILHGEGLELGYPPRQHDLYPRQSASWLFKWDKHLGNRYGKHKYAKRRKNVNLPSYANRASFL